MDDFEKMMAEVGSDFDNASADSFGEEVPDGQYILLVNKGEIKQSKSSGRWQISWDFTVIWDPKGRYRNRHVFVHDGITKVNEGGKHEPNEGGMRAIKNRMKVAGFGVVPKDQLAKAVSQMPGRVLAATIKTNKEFVNVYFDALVATSLDAYKAPASLDALKKTIDSAKSQATSSPGNATLPTQRTVVSAEKPKLNFTDQ
jgi:hypothetical protein